MSPCVINIIWWEVKKPLFNLWKKASLRSNSHVVKKDEISLCFMSHTGGYILWVTCFLSLLPPWFLSPTCHETRKVGNSDLIYGLPEETPFPQIHHFDTLLRKDQRDQHIQPAKAVSISGRKCFHCSWRQKTCIIATPPCNNHQRSTTIKISLRIMNIYLSNHIINQPVDRDISLEPCPIFDNGL